LISEFYDQCIIIKVIFCSFTLSSLPPTRSNRLKSVTEVWPVSKSSWMLGLE